MHSCFFQTIIIALAAMTTVASTDIFLPSLPAIAAYFGATPEETQLSIPFAMAGALVGSPLMGSFSDYYGKKKVLFAGMLLFFCASVGCIYAPSMSVFLLSRFLQGIGATTSFVVGWAIIMEIYPQDESAKIMSWMGTIIATAPMIAPTLGGYLHVLFGWRSNFILIAGLTGLLVILTALSRPPLPAITRDKSFSFVMLLKSYTVILKDKFFLYYIAFFILLQCGLWSYITLVPFYFESVVGLSPEIFGIYLSAGVLFYICGTLLTPLFLRYLDSMKTIFLGLVFALMGSLGLLYVSFAMPSSPVFITLSIGFYMLGTGTVWGPSTSRAFRRIQGMHGTASAVRGLLVTAAITVGSLVGSFLEESLTFLALFLMATTLLCFRNFVYLQTLERKEQ